MITIKKAEMKIVKSESGLYFMVSEGCHILISEELAKMICEKKKVTSYPSAS